jgi:fructose-1,6-bisphosphatase I/sedoheptulose-1,7-bisphosphatase
MRKRMVGHLAGMASEEMDSPYQIPGEYPRGKYLLVFDPLDGSSNIDVNVSVGSIFSILRAPQDAIDSGATSPMSRFPAARQPQVAAGYAIYGPSTMLVLTVGNGVARLHAGPDLGEWVLTHPNIRCPRTPRVRDQLVQQPLLGAPVKRYVDECLAGKTGPRGKDFNMRWIASLVAEAHRILMRGGVFMYPRDNKDPPSPAGCACSTKPARSGFIIEQAGGRASTGRRADARREPDHALHQRIGFVFGSRNEVERIERYHEEPPDAYASPLFPGAPVREAAACFASGSCHVERHPIIAITGSSGAGTSSVTRTFQASSAARRRHRRDHRGRQLPPLRPQGDAASAGRSRSGRRPPLQPLRRGEQPVRRTGNLFATTRNRQGKAPQVSARRRRGGPLQAGAGHLHRVGGAAADTDCCSMKGCTAPWSRRVNIAKHPDLLIGVVPVINLEWIQKLHRDKNVRGYSTEAVTDTILRRMPDYVHYICPQFGAHARQLPARARGRHQQPVHRARHPQRRREHGGDPLRQPQGHRLSLPAEHDHDSFMSRANTIVVPGGKMELAMQLIFTPFIWRMMERRKPRATPSTASRPAWKPPPDRWVRVSAMRWASPWRKS